MLTASIRRLDSLQRSSPDIRVVAGGEVLQTALIQQAIDSCAAAGGGRVVLCAGTHRSGTIVLRSRVTLHLEKDARLVGSVDIDDYHRPEQPLSGRMIGAVATALLFADDVEDIGVTGEGTIDGNGPVFCSKRATPVDWIEEKKALGLWIPGFDNQSSARPRALVLFVRCRGVRFEGVRLVNSPSWMMHLLACSHVNVRHVTLRGLIGGSNTDGIDLDACCDVQIEDCDIETGDDAIALKNTNSWGLKRPSRRIVVQRCRLASTTHGFTIGTETEEDFEEVILRDSHIDGVGDYRVLTGIGLDMVDGSRIRDVTVTRVTIANAIAPVHVRLGNAGRGQAVRAPGEIRAVTLEDVTIRKAFGNCLVAGLPDHPLRQIVLRRVTMEFADVIEAARVLRDVPEFDGEFPRNEAWRWLPAYGFYFRHVAGLELAEVAITRMVDDRRPALLLEDVDGLTQRAVRTG